LGCAIAAVAFLFVLAGAFWLGTRVGALWVTRESPEPWNVPPLERPLFPFEGRPGPHGALGEVLRVEGDKIIVRNRFGVEQTLCVTPKTIIERGRRHISLEDIRRGERVIAIGSPQPDGSIQIRIIRVLEKR